jgi:cation:H+ antiporter
MFSNTFMKPSCNKSCASSREWVYRLHTPNIIGANVIDLSLILPLCSVVSGKNIPVPVQSATIDMPVCLGILVMGLVPLLIREKGSKLQGGLMMAAYIAYLVFTI